MMTPEYEQYCINQVEPWLLKVRKAVDSAKRLEESAAAHYAKADNLKGIDYSAVRVQSSPTPDAIPNAVAEHIAIGDKLTAISENAKAWADEADAALAKMDSQDESMCLRLYYVHAVDSWDDVCDRMGLKYDSVMKLRRRALISAYAVMPHSERDAIPQAY